MLDRTNFYAEQGGQVGDTRHDYARRPAPSRSTTRSSSATRSCTSAGSLTGTLEVGQPATLEVGGGRPHTMRNHTATHLLNWALREVLGDHVEQKGSLVDAEKTRFDFTHDKPLTPEEIAAGRAARQREDLRRPAGDARSTMPLAEAKKLPGVRAVFGEKYPDPVRVLLIGADDAGEGDAGSTPSSSAAART